MSWDCVSFDLNTKLLQPDVQLSQQLELVYQITVFTELLVLFPQPFHFPHSCVDEIDRYCLKTLTEDFLNFLNPISSVTLSSARLSCLHATCALCMFHFIMMKMLLSCYACT